MASSVSITRLRKEFNEIRKNPLENIRAAPKETNILEWHYVILGPKGSPYEGGFYHGTVIFPKEYPYKPPSIQMFTPNGRFETNKRLCLSMSDFHPETWNPMWSVGTILMGLYTFMLDSQPTFGSIVTTDLFKKQCAIESMKHNIKNKIFCELFPELIEEYEERLKNQPVLPASQQEVIEKTSESNTSWVTILGILAAILACTWALLGWSI